MGTLSNGAAGRRWCRVARLALQGAVDCALAAPRLHDRALPETLPQLLEEKPSLG